MAAGEVLAVCAPTSAMVGGRKRHELGGCFGAGLDVRTYYITTPVLAGAEGAMTMITHRSRARSCRLGPSSSSPLADPQGAPQTSVTEKAARVVEQALALIGLDLGWPRGAIPHCYSLAPSVLRGRLPCQLGTPE